MSQGVLMTHGLSLLCKVRPLFAAERNPQRFMRLESCVCPPVQAVAAWPYKGVASKRTIGTLSRMAPGKSLQRLQRHHPKEGQPQAHLQLMLHAKIGLQSSRQPALGAFRLPSRLEQIYWHPWLEQQPCLLHSLGHSLQAPVEATAADCWGQTNYLVRASS